MPKKQKNKRKIPADRNWKPSKKEIGDMIDSGVFDKFILKDIAKETGISYKELLKTSKDIKKKNK